MQKYKLILAVFMLLSVFLIPLAGCLDKEKSDENNKIDAEKKEKPVSSPSEKNKDKKTENKPEDIPKSEPENKSRPGENPSPNNQIPPKEDEETIPFSWWLRRIPNSPPEIDGKLLGFVYKYNGLYIGDTTKKQVALTFDLGDEGNENAPQALDILAKYNVKATFFVTGKWVENHPDLLKRIVFEGHSIGNHSYSHPDFSTISNEEAREQIIKTEELIRQQVGIKPKFFRPPFGKFTGEKLALIQSMGYTTTFWGVSMRDWLPMPFEEYTNGVVKYAHNGAVVLLHLTPEGSAALDVTIPKLQGMGYKLVSVEKIRQSGE